MLDANIYHYSSVVGGLHNEALVSPIFTNFRSYKTVLSNVHHLIQVLLISPWDVCVTGTVVRHALAFITKYSYNDSNRLEKPLMSQDFDH